MTLKTGKTAYKKDYVLTPYKVKKIKILLKEGKLTQREIAKKFKTSQPNICQINKERSWPNNWKSINRYLKK